MTGLEGKTISIGSLFSQSYFFRIPEYQRPFSWEEEHFEDLIDDLLAADKNSQYFLGTLVLHQVDDAGTHEVVDGQQRLTSLMILLACLRDRVKGRKYIEGVQAKITQEENVVDGIPARSRLEVKDRKLFAQVVETLNGTTSAAGATRLPEPEWRYIEAVRVFSEKLAELKQAELRALIEYVSQKCMVIYLATSTFDDAFRLFTIVNDRGRQLRRIDVLKSMNIAPDVVGSQATRNRIAQRWEESEKRVGEAKFESISHHVRLVLLKDKPRGDLLKEFDGRIFPKNLVQRGERFANLIFSYVDTYCRLFEDRDIIPDADPDHVKYQSLIHIMDAEFKASEWRACLLFFTRRFDGKRVYEFCRKLERTYLGHWVQSVRKDERYAQYAKILSLIETSRKPGTVLKGMNPATDAIKEAAVASDLYHSGYCKYFLLRLELAAAELSAPREFNAKSIEHVLPQNPAAGSGWAKKHNLNKIGEYVHSLGNLVLLSKSKNSSASNLDFDDKKEKYLKPRVSDYPRSIQVLSEESWTKATIAKRTAEAGERLLSDL